MRYCLLGKVGVQFGSEFVSSPSPMVCCLLAAFLAEPRRTMPVHRLVEVLWDEDPPASAEANLRGYVTRLRRLLPDPNVPPMVTRRGGGGYGLFVDDNEIDLQLFRRTMAHGRKLAAAGDLMGAEETMRRGVLMWRGPFGTELPDTWFVRTLSAGLNAERVSAVEDLAAVLLSLRDGHEAAAQLTPLLAEDPSLEQGWALLTLAHYLISGNAAALRTAHHAVSALHSALGKRPLPQLLRVVQAIQSGEAEKELGQGLAARRGN